MNKPLQRELAITENCIAWDSTIIIDASACCNNDTDRCNETQRDAAIKISKKKSHQFKKNYILKNRVSYKNQTTTIFQGIYFCPESLFEIYSGEKSYLLTGGDKHCSC